MIILAIPFAFAAATATLVYLWATFWQFHALQADSWGWVVQYTMPTAGICPMGHSRCRRRCRRIDPDGAGRRLAGRRRNRARRP